MCTCIAKLDYKTFFLLRMSVTLEKKEKKTKLLQFSVTEYAMDDLPEQADTVAQN